MTATQRFIEKALEGGWDDYLRNCSWSLSGTEVWADNGNGIPARYTSLNEMLLNPAAWQAVGKVEGWGDFLDQTDGMPAWKARMHWMIDALAEGKDIESYLSEIV